MRIFTDRIDAGAQLAEQLNAALPWLRSSSGVVVLGLARGGVPVARVVAESLGSPLDAMMVRKLGAPHQPEFAMGAIATGGHIVVNGDVPARLGISPAQFEAVQRRESVLLAERELLYRGEKPPIEMAGRIVVLVDDGVATGSTMAVAIRAVRAAGAARVIVALPTGPLDALRALRQTADDVVCVLTPEPFGAVGSSYRDFSPTSDDEVRRALRAGRDAAGDVRRRDER